MGDRYEVEVLVISRSPRRLVLVCGGSVLAVVLGAIALRVGYDGLPDPLSWLFVALLAPCLAIFAVAAVVLAVSAIRLVPAAVCTASGIRTWYFPSVRAMAWDEVDGIELKAYGGHQMIVVRALDPGGVIDRERSWLRRWFLRYNDRHGLGVVALPGGALARPVETSAALMRAMWFRARD